MADPDEVLLDPPADAISMVDDTDEQLTVTEVTVPTSLDTGMDPAVCALRTLANHLQERADAGRPRTVLSVTVTYERDPFHLVNAVLIHGPQADQT